MAGWLAASWTSTCRMLSPLPTPGSPQPKPELPRQGGEMGPRWELLLQGQRKKGQKSLTKPKAPIFSCYYFSTPDSSSASDQHPQINSHRLGSGEALRDGEEGLSFNSMDTARTQANTRPRHHGRKPGSADLSQLPLSAQASSRLGTSGRALTQG